MHTTAETLTLEAYASLDDGGDEYVTELVRGRLVREPRPGRRHGQLQARVAHLLTVWVLDRGVGEVFTESGVVLRHDPPTLRGPDVAVLLDPTRDHSGPGGWLAGAPDVAVEVLPPSDSSVAIQQKVLDYLEGGAARVWILDPETLSATVFRPDGSASVIKEDGTLTGEDVLPGFSVTLEALFAD